ncbi:MAG TPA: hypothetical protein PLD59_16070, partial [Tepidisphaeraceae bacterium]|nr:hypothetical protein [Tepidisphaeraceae bacterium]
AFQRPNNETLGSGTVVADDVFADLNQFTTGGGEHRVLATLHAFRFRLERAPLSALFCMHSFSRFK